MRHLFLLVLIFGFFFFHESSAQIAPSNNVDNAASVEKIYTISEYSASFPGGGFERNRYFYNLIERNRKALSSDGSQVCQLKFIVDKEGNISEITSINIVETKLDELVIKALVSGPKWIPARQNGFKVNAYASLTLIFESKNSGKRTYARGTIKYFLTKENKVEKQVQKLLVLAGGTIPTRIFADELYEDLKTDLRNNNVETEYLFLGNEEKTAYDKFMNAGNSKTFDAILLLTQADVPIIKEVYLGTEISMRSISLQQSMNIYIIEPGDLETSIMEGKIFMNYRLTKKSVYAKASKDLLNILKQNMIINTAN